MFTENRGKLLADSKTSCRNQLLISWADIDIDMSGNISEFHRSEGIYIDIPFTYIVYRGVIRVGGGAIPGPPLQS